MECPVVKGVYTIAMTTHGETRQWCPSCKVFHATSGEPMKQVDAGSDINEGRMVKRPERGCK
jgi:hypothetical protein